jgi:hypothetical protein
MVLLCDEAQLEPLSILLGIVLILTQDRCTVCVERTIGSEIVGECTQWNSLVTWVMWNLVLVHLETVLVSKCRCKICSRFAPNVPQAQKSFWRHPMELLGEMCHVESRFGPFGDNVSVGAR